MLIDCVRKKINFLSSAGILLLMFAVDAAGYVPFPGKIPVNLLSIETPIVIHVNFETWPGFMRSFRVTIPGLSLPMDAASAPDCERVLATKARAFTETFLSEAAEITIRDMDMENSADQDGRSQILTNKGSLGQALQKEGLARPDSVEPGESWC